MYRVMFVCFGNLVRSPAAKLIFNDAVTKSGEQDKYWADSAGTVGYYVGEDMDPRMRWALNQFGISGDHEIKRLNRKHLRENDLIACMNNSNRESVINLTQTNDQLKKVYLLGHFNSGGPHEIHDPYYDEDIVFIKTVDIIRDCINGLLEWIRCMERRDG